MYLTLISNNETIFVDPSNVAFVACIEDEDENGVKTSFSRIYLKQLAVNMDETPTWIDVTETVRQIGSRITKKSKDKE